MAIKGGHFKATYLVSNTSGIECSPKLLTGLESPGHFGSGSWDHSLVGGESEIVVEG